MVSHRADPAQPLLLSIAVKQQNTERLTEELYAVSDPKSPRFGQHLSFEEVNALVSPSQQSLEAVREWLARFGLTPKAVTPNADFLEVLVNVSVAEAMLQAEYWVYKHTSGATITRLALSDNGVTYTLPNEVATHIDFVGPTSTFPVQPKRVTPRDIAAPLLKPTVFPSRMRGLRNLTAADVGKGSNSNFVQGVASFLGQYFDPSDSEAFAKKYKIPLSNITRVPKNTPIKPVGDEASLDIQWITVTGEGITTQVWSTDGKQPGNPDNEPFVKWLTAVAADANAPNLFSISYGDDETGVSSDFAQRASTEFQKAGARGISLLAASGDGGAGCSTNGFVPTFPASCPYITGVGATTRGTPGVSPTREVVYDISGGGFSNYFTRPSYQDAAVAAYKKSGLLPAKKNWNADGAGFPDISDQGEGFDTCTEGFFYPISGTSAACPSASGVIALLLQARLDAKKPLIGWLNPFLYALGAAQKDHAFNDVTEGRNTFCDADTGFPARTGWDPVSGWGTLNYGRLKPYFQTMGNVNATRPVVPTFDQFRIQFNKEYSSPEEQQKRALIYAANTQKLSQTYFPDFVTGVNRFSDMQVEEVPRGYRYSEPVDAGIMFAPHTRAAPTSVDWRSKGAVSEVRDQGQGETCWSFSTAGAVEGARVLKGANMTALSPQMLIDCMNIPCSDSSGTMDNAFAWVAKNNKGLMDSWDSYKYVDGDCIFWDPPHNCKKTATLVPGLAVKSYTHVKSKSEADLLLAVAQQPVSVAIYSGLHTFTTYKSGIYNDANCKDTMPQQLDHAVLVVGYGSEGGKDYWIVKNSWGPKWGEDGFVRMARNVGNSGICGIAIDAAFPNLD